AGAGQPGTFRADHAAGLWPAGVDQTLQAAQRRDRARWYRDRSRTELRVESVVRPAQRKRPRGKPGPFPFRGRSDLVDWNGQTEADAGRAIARGRVIGRRRGRVIDRRRRSNIHRPRVVDGRWVIGRRPEFEVDAAAVVPVAIAIPAVTISVAMPAMAIP